MLFNISASPFVCATTRLLPLSRASLSATPRAYSLRSEFSLITTLSGRSHSSVKTRGRSTRFRSPFAAPSVIILSSVSESGKPFPLHFACDGQAAQTEYKISSAVFALRSASVRETLPSFAIDDDISSNAADASYSLLDNEARVRFTLYLPKLSFLKIRNFLLSFFILSCGINA